MGKQRVLNYVIAASWDGKGATRAAKADMESLGPAGEKGATGAKGLGTALGGLEKAAGALVAAGLLAKLGEGARQFAEESLAAASDAEESYAKFETVFKETAGVVEVELENIAAATGRSKFGLIDYAATLQDTFVPLGFARDEAAELSTTLVQLAIDLASFNNLNTDEVVRDLQSALVGNTETLRKYGVVATQAAIEAKALADGLWDGTGAIDAQAKAAAILAITLDSTTDAQGDAARTIDSYANKQRQAEAATKDLQVAFGQSISLLAEAKVETQIYIAEALLPLVEAWAGAAVAAKEAGAGIQEFLAGGDGATISNFRSQLQEIEQAINDIALTSPSAALAFKSITEEALLPLLGAAGKTAESTEELRAIYEAMGIEVTEHGIKIGEGIRTIIISWEELNRAVEESRLVEKLAEIDAALGPVDEKMFAIAEGAGFKDRAEELAELARQAEASRAAIEGLVRVEPFEGVSRPENLAHLRAFVADILAGGGSAAETIARIRAEYQALIDTGRDVRAGFFADFFDTELLNQQFGEFFQFTIDYSTRITELQEELGKLDEKMADGGELTENQAEKYAELAAELEGLAAAHGQVATAFDTDEQFVGLVNILFDAAAGAGAAGEQLLALAGNTDAAREAMESAAFAEFAQNLGQQIAEGTITAQGALQELQDFMEGFDLDAFLQSQNIVGSGEQSSEAIKDQMLGYVEGIDAVAAEAATAAGTETQKVIDLATDLEGPWPYTIDTSGVQAAIGDTQKLLDLVKELEGAWAFAGGSSSGIPGGGGVPGGPGDVPGSGGGPGGGAAVSGLPPGFDFPPASSPSTGSGAGVTSTQPPLTVQVFAAPGMSPAAVADLVMYEIAQYGYQLRG